jgi:hypothetical protein
MLMQGGKAIHPRGWLFYQENIMNISIRDLKLQEKYPKILKQLGGDPRITCMSADHDGIAIGDGWIPLLEKLFDFCQFHHDKNGYPQLVAEQIKEKFGTLRFYYSFEKCTSETAHLGKQFNRDEKMLEGAIAFAEMLSGTICESCGKPSKVSGKRWRTTLCDDCKTASKY